jgi:hypothetical protein
MCQWIVKLSTNDIKYVIRIGKAAEELHAHKNEIMRALVWSMGLGAEQI